VPSPKPVLVYHPAVGTDDLPLIDSRMRDRTRRAIDGRLATSPESYGVPLRKNLKGLWKMRVGDYRVVFKPAGNEILILAIHHRKNVYEISGKRRSWPATS